MKITISKGATINLGNYESARVDFSAEGDDNTVTVLEIEQLVDDYLSRKISEIQSQAGLPPSDPRKFIG